MIYDSMPLYPALRPDRGQDACVRFPVFGGGSGDQDRPIDESRCRRVWIENPCRPGEVAEVLLSVDGCGNLVGAGCTEAGKPKVVGGGRFLQPLFGAHIPFTARIYTVELNHERKVFYGQDTRDAGG